MTPNKITTAAIGAVVVAAVVAVGYTSFTPKGAKQQASSLATSANPAIAAAPQTNPSQAAPQAAAPLKITDCAAESDRCGCSARVAGEFLSTAFPARALETTKSAPSDCANRNLIQGMQAEALAAIRDEDQAKKLANEVLSRDPQNRFARRALAIIEVMAARWTEAEAQLGKLITEDASDADSTYYAALVNSRRNRYNEARQGFLRVLRLNKRHIDARFNLVTLVAGAGATAEAFHHFEELQSIAPVGDPRIANARAALGGSAPQAPSIVIQQTEEGPTRGAGGAGGG